MVDDFSARYGDLLSGSYGCVDPIVLNAYMSLCHSPGGFGCGGALRRLVGLGLGAAAMVE